MNSVKLYLSDETHVIYGFDESAVEYCIVVIDKHTALKALQCVAKCNDFQILKKVVAMTKKYCPNETAQFIQQKIPKLLQRFLIIQKDIVRQMNDILEWS